MSDNSKYCKVPCSNCPFRKDIEPYLTPERAVEISTSAMFDDKNFYCHKTIEHTGEKDTFGSDIVNDSKAKTCAGFLTLRSNYGGKIPKGFKPSKDLCYKNHYEMYKFFKNK